MSILCRFTLVLLFGSVAAAAFHVGEKVMARWTSHKYFPGVIEEISYDEIKIQFDDGDEIPHDPSDVTAVFPNKSPPGFYRGDHVISQRQGGGTDYYIGFIILPPGELTLKILYDDHVIGDITLSKLRMLPKNYDSTHTVGARVFARWPANGHYFRGFVHSVTDSELTIKFDDGDSYTHWKTDTAAVILDRFPDPKELQVDRPVIGYWPGTVDYFPGNIVSISQNGAIHVKFNDGDERDEKYYEIRMLPI